MPWTSPGAPSPPGRRRPCPACFVLLVNTVPTFALACSGVSGLDSMTLSFVDGALPDRFTLELFFMPLPERAEASQSVPPEPAAGALEEDPRHAPGVLCFTFGVTLDPSRILCCAGYIPPGAGIQK